MIVVLQGAIIRAVKCSVFLSMLDHIIKLPILLCIYGKGYSHGCSVSIYTAVCSVVFTGDISGDCSQLLEK